MDPTLLAVYIGILCAAMVVLLVWMVVSLVRLFKKGKKDELVAEIDGKLYRLVPVDAASDGDAEAVAAVSCGQPEGEVAGVGQIVVDSDAIVLRRAESVSYAEAYAALSSEQKRYADEIIAYAKNREETKETSNERGITVYFGKKPLVQVSVRKGMVNARLSVPNNDLAAYADSANIRIKEKPIDFKIDDASKVGAAKDIIDLIHRSILEERVRRAQAKKERRRQARLAKRAAQNNQKGGEV